MRGPRHGILRYIDYSTSSYDVAASLLITCGDMIKRIIRDLISKYENNLIFKNKINTYNHIFQIL